MAVKGKRAYVEFTGSNQRTVAIKLVPDIYKGLATHLGATVKGVDESPSKNAVVVTSIEDALRNGVASITVTYEKSGRKQQGNVLCSSDAADTVLNDITGATYRNNNITSGRFSR